MFCKDFFSALYMAQDKEKEVARPITDFSRLRMQSCGGMEEFKITDRSSWKWAHASWLVGSAPSLAMTPRYGSRSPSPACSLIHNLSSDNGDHGRGRAAGRRYHRTFMRFFRGAKRLFCILIKKTNDNQSISGECISISNTIHTCMYGWTCPD